MEPAGNLVALWCRADNSLIAMSRQRKAGLLQNLDYIHRGRGLQPLQCNGEGEYFDITNSRVKGNSKVCLEEKRTTCHAMTRTPTLTIHTKSAILILAKILILGACCKKFHQAVQRALTSSPAKKKIQSPQL